MRFVIIQIQIPLCDQGRTAPTASLAAPGAAVSRYSFASKAPYDSEYLLGSSAAEQEGKIVLILPNLDEGTVLVVENKDGRCTLPEFFSRFRRSRDSYDEIVQA